MSKKKVAIIFTGGTISMTVDKEIGAAIPTLSGEARITITPGTQPGKVLRMRGKGLPQIDQYGRTYGTGDLLINVGVYIPEKLSKDERKLIEQLQDSPNIVPGSADKKNFFQNLFG